MLQPRPASLPRIGARGWAPGEPGCLPRAAGSIVAEDLVSSSPGQRGREGWKVVSLPARGQSSPDPTQPAYSEPRCSGFGNEGSSGRGSCASPGSRNSGGGGVLLLAGLSRCPLRLQAVVTPAHPRLPLQRVRSGLWMPPSSVPEGFSGKCCRKPLQIRIARTFQGPNRFWLRIRPLRR